VVTSPDAAVRGAAVRGAAVRGAAVRGAAVRGAAVRGAAGRCGARAGTAYAWLRLIRKRPRRARRRPVRL